MQKKKLPVGIDDFGKLLRRRRCAKDTWRSILLYLFR